MSLERIWPDRAAVTADDLVGPAQAAPEDLIREIVIFGTPEEMRARLDEFVAGGITTPVLTFLSGPDQLPGLIDALAP